MNTISIQVPSISENIRMIESFIDNAKERFQLDDDMYGNIMIAVTEAVNNAIKHGNQHDSTKRVFVEFATALNSVPEMIIHVRDQGAGFDPEAVADPLAPENLLKGSGRGIFLIRNFMDEVDVHRAPQGGMEVRMVKRGQAAGTPDASANV